MNNTSAEASLHFLDYWRVIRVRLPLIIFVFLLVVITAGVVTYLMPRQYQSTVTMEVKENNTSLAVFDRDSGAGVDPRFVTTQFEIIQRKEILYPVIEKLGLVSAWHQRYGVGSKEQAYIKLKNSIDVKEVRNTDLIEISALDQDSKEAMEIANAIGAEYQSRRVSEQQNWTAKSLVQLQDDVERQSEKIDDLRAVAAKLRISLGINDPAPESDDVGQTAPDQVLNSDVQEVNTERLHVGALKAKFDAISSMTDDQIMRSITTLEVSDPMMTEVVPKLQEAESDKASLLNSGLGPKHPEILSLQAKIDVMNQQLHAQIEALRKTLQSNLKIAQDALSSMEHGLQDAKDSQQGSKTKASAYYQAKNTYLQAKKVLEAAEMRLSTERMQVTMPQSPATIWEYAEQSSYPSRPRVWLNMALGVVVGLVFALGLAFFIEYLDTSVKTMQDVETFLQLPVLAVVPKNVRVLMNEEGNSPDSEAYRIMRTNIEFNRKNPSANSITLVSGGAGEGKSTTLANLAFVFAQGGYNTLVVDADLRRPSQHRIFRVSNEIGLTDYLTKDVALEDIVIQSKQNNLFFLPSGQLPEDAVGVLNSQRMVELIEELKSRFDFVFFDSPPILGVSDAAVLASEVDLTVMVVQHRRFPRAMMQRVKQSVLNVGGTLLGVVLNNVDVRHDQYYEYYTSYYGYYSANAKRKTTRPRQKAEPERPATENKDDQY